MPMNVGVCVDTAHERHMNHAGELEIVDIDRRPGIKRGSSRRLTGAPMYLLNTML